MKKIASLLACLMLCTMAAAQVPYAWQVLQRDSTGMETNYFEISPTPGVNCMMQMSGTSPYLPSCVPVASVPSQASASRSMNSAFQISSTRNALAYYSVQMTVTSTVASGQDGEVVLEIASNSGFSSNVQTVAVQACSQTFTVVVAIQGVQKCPIFVAGFVPAGYYARLRTVNSTGAPAYLYRAGQEILL